MKLSKLCILSAAMVAAEMPVAAWAQFILGNTGYTQTPIMEIGPARYVSGQPIVQAFTLTQGGGLPDPSLWYDTQLDITNPGGSPGNQPLMSASGPAAIGTQPIFNGNQIQFQVNTDVYSFDQLGQNFSSYVGNGQVGLDDLAVIGPNPLAPLTQQSFASTDYEFYLSATVETPVPKFTYNSGFPPGFTFSPGTSYPLSFSLANTSGVSPTDQNGSLTIGTPVVQGNFANEFQSIPGSGPPGPAGPVGPSSQVINAGQTTDVGLFFTPSAADGYGQRTETLVVPTDLYRPFGVTTNPISVTFTINVPLPVAPGSAAFQPLFGGTQPNKPGTLDVSLPASNSGGNLSATYTGEVPVSNLPGPPGTFKLAGIGGTETQLWDITFSGVLNGGEAEVIVEYDPALLGGVDPSTLYIEHYTSSGWVPITPLSVDTTNDTIVFLTPSFSPFALAVSVPEPAAMGLLIFVPVLLRRRRRA